MADQEPQNKPAEPGRQVSAVPGALPASGDTAVYKPSTSPTHPVRPNDDADIPTITMPQQTPAYLLKTHTSLSAAYFDTLIRAIDFHGRSTRKQYWTFILLNAAVTVGGIVLCVLLFYVMAQKAAQGNVADVGAPPIALVFMAFLVFFNLLMVIPTIAVTFRRLHDVGMSGWWFGARLIFSGVAQAANIFLIGKSENPSLLMVAVYLVLAGIAATLSIVIFVATLLPSQQKANAYGPYRR